MAKYEVTYSCGHTGTVALFGAGKDREAKLEWYHNTAVCPDCYRQQVRATEQTKTIIRLIPGQNPESLVPALQKDLEKERQHEHFYQSRIDAFVKEHFKGANSEDDEKSWLAGKLHIGMGAGESDLRELRKTQNKIRNIENDIEKVKKQGIVNPVIEYVAINSFKDKDKLRTSGYRYDSSGYWSDPVGLKTMPAWIKRIEVKPENYDRITAELQYVKTLGDVEGDNLLNTLTAGPREGRIISFSEGK